MAFRVGDDLVVIDEQNIDILAFVDKTDDRGVQLDKDFLGLGPIVVTDLGHFLHGVQNLIDVAKGVDDLILAQRQELKTVRSYLYKPPSIFLQRKILLHEAVYDLPSFQLEIALGIILIRGPGNGVERGRNAAGHQHLHEQGCAGPLNS